MEYTNYSKEFINYDEPQHDYVWGKQLRVAEKLYAKELERQQKCEAEARRLQQRKEHALQKREAFLAFAGAIGLHPYHYAEWVASYLKFGGTASRTAEDFPYEAHDPSFKDGSYWLLTNPEVMAEQMPANYGSNRMHVFLGEQKHFLRQFKLATGSVLGLTAPRNARTEHPTGPYFQSGAAAAYGDNVVHYYDDVEIERRFREPTHLQVARANRPDHVEIHRDIIPIVYEIADTDRFVLQQLDTIVTNGTNRPK